MNLRGGTKGITPLKPTEKGEANEGGKGRLKRSIAKEEEGAM